MIKRNLKGQGLVEYALLLILITVVSLLALSLAGISISDIFSGVGSLFQPTSNQCLPIAQAGEEWDELMDKFWRGGITTGENGYEVCRLCGGILPGFSGSDYEIDLSGVSVDNVTSSWNGYGVAFRAEYTKNGLNGYMFEIEKANKNSPAQIYFSKWVNGKQIKPPLAVKNMPANFNWDNPPEMRIEVKGDTFTAYLDGQSALSAQDKTYTDGGVGVISNLGTQLAFKDINVNALDCED